MKKLVFVIANLIVAASTVYASSEVEFKKAEIGQTMTLRKDVIFNEGVKEKIMSSRILQLPEIDGEKIDVEVSCLLSREEDGDGCSGFKKTKVSAGKTLIIADAPSSTADFHDYSTRKDVSVLVGKSVAGGIIKNKCTYSLTFSCYFHHGVNAFRKPILEIAEAEILFQASQNIKIQEDASEPTPWP
ncbi:MAG: hypothetical protein ACXVCP_14160 [Bdellovibrio sp.]